MAWWTACIWQQRLFGHWIYQKIAAPKNDPLVVVTAEIMRSSRAIENVHHLPNGNFSVINISNMGKNGDWGFPTPKDEVSSVSGIMTPTVVPS